MGNMKKDKGKAPSLTAIFLAMFVMTYMFTIPVFAGDCEVVSSLSYTEEQEVVATEWKAGIPYMKQQTEVYPCASVTVRNTDWLKQSSRDIHITATFADKSKTTKKFACSEKILNPEDEYSCTVCFETQSSITDLSCRFR
jgi:hypothetical protein